MQLVIEQRRGGLTEASHPISAVLVADGKVVERVGPPLRTTWRSAAKPFQLEVSLGLLPPPVAQGLAPEQVAIGASSHHGQPIHIETVQALLAQLGHSETDLYCGAHWPIDDNASRALAALAAKPSAVHNNCSGKHSYMAAASRHHGWNPDYRDPKHPLQVKIRRVVDLRTEGGCDGAVVDGCGVPCFRVTLEGMARAYASVASDTGVLARVAEAMRTNWLHASGSTAIDGALMREATEPTVAKVGAEGLLCGVVPGRGYGFAVKALSGHEGARAVALQELLHRWVPDLVPASVFRPWSVLNNCVGVRVGERVAVVS
jgi:L-asparaginase II